MYLSVHLQFETVMILIMKWEKILEKSEVMLAALILC